MIRKIILKYGLIGFAIGLIFPILSIIIEIIYKRYEFSYESIYLIHKENLMLFIVELAPIVISSFTILVGINKNRYIKKNNELLILNQELKIELDRIKHLEKELKKQANTDFLTGILNRRAGILVLNKLCQLNKRNDDRLSICFLDLDKLKEINDSKGHEAGDELIKRFVRLFKDGIRESDVFCRLGGDEFLIIFPKCSRLKAIEIIDRIRKKDDTVEFSYGFGEMSEKATHRSIDEFIKVADNNMYQMKIIKKFLKKQKEKNKSEAIY